jgi:uncharacterized protein (TIGR00661 family)
VKVPSIGFIVKPDGTVDFRQTTVNPGPFIASLTFLKQVDAEINIMKAFKPTLVVSDSRVSSLIAAKLLDIPSICILNQFQVIIPRRQRFLRLARLADAFTLTIIGKIWTSGITILIPDFPPPYTLSIRNLQIPKTYREQLRFIGPIIPIYPNELPSQKEIRRQLELSEDKPLIFVPISGPVKERLYLTEILQEALKPLASDYHIVMSRGDPKASEEPIREGNFTIHNWIFNRFSYLKACDLVITRAGHGTVTQSIAYGKPAILVPTPNHTEQYNISKAAVGLGISQMMMQEKLNKRSLRATIESMFEDREFQIRVKAIQKEVQGLQGLQTAVDQITNIAEEALRNDSAQ